MMRFLHQLNPHNYFLFADAPVILDAFAPAPKERRLIKSNVGKFPLRRIHARNSIPALIEESMEVVFAFHHPHENRSISCRRFRHNKNGLKPYPQDGIFFRAEHRFQLLRQQCDICNSRTLCQQVESYRFAGTFVCHLAFSLPRSYCQCME